MKDMEFKPGKGIGSLRFGMTTSEVSEIAGQPDRIHMDEEESNDEIWEYNAQKMRLTFYADENNRFGYFECQHPDLRFNGNKILHSNPDFVINEVFSGTIKNWEREDYGLLTTFFNEDFWITLHVEFDTVTDLECGVPYKTDEEYNWPE